MTGLNIANIKHERLRTRRMWTRTRRKWPGSPATPLNMSRRVSFIGSLVFHMCRSSVYLVSMETKSDNFHKVPPWQMFLKTSFSAAL